MEFLVLARLSGTPAEPKGNRLRAVYEAHGALAISQHLDTRNQPIYAWAGRSAGSVHLNMFKFRQVGTMAG